MSTSTNDFQKLVEQYENDMELDDTPNNLSLRIPKRITKYVIYMEKLFEAIGDTQEKLDAIMANSIKDYRMQQGEYANINFNATELNKILKADTVYSTQARKLVRLESQLKVLDGMMSDVRALGYAVNNKITIARLSHGVTK